MASRPKGIDPKRINQVRAVEERRFAERTVASAALVERARKCMPNGVPMAWMAGYYDHPPLYVTHGKGAWFEDADANRYLDMNQADLAAALGFAPDAVTEAVRRRAARGVGFLLPGEDGIVAAELLGARTGLPLWQFTGSASASNMELIRLARLATGRHRILMFEGKYHGHIEDTLVEGRGDDLNQALLGLLPDAKHHARIVPFNDLEALAEALKDGDIACLIAEPMLTNCNIVFPDQGFWAEARKLVDDAGSLLFIDEAHTFSFAHGGLTRAWGLEPDAVTLGKGLGTGIPFAVHGMTAELGDLLARHLDGGITHGPGIAVGGTTFANAIALAAARAALESCLTEAAYERTAALGMRLGDGLEAHFARHGLDWRAPRIGGRSGWVLFPDLPRNAGQAMRSLDLDFVHTRRLFMANRGVWEAIAEAGPAVSFAHDEADVDRYLEVAGAYLDSIHQV